jgi:hypothetical protein
VTHKLRIRPAGHWSVLGLLLALSTSVQAGGSAPRPRDPDRDKVVAKYAKIDGFEAWGLAPLQRSIDEALGRAKVDERTAVAAIHEIMRLGVRVGSTVYASRPKGGESPEPSYGASTLWDFVKPLRGRKGVRLDFAGKDQVRWRLTFRAGGDVEMAFEGPKPKARPGTRPRSKKAATSKKPKVWSVNLERAVHPKLAEVVRLLGRKATKNRGRLEVVGDSGHTVVVHDARIQQRLQQQSGVEEIWNHGLRHLRARQLLRQTLRQVMKLGVPRSAREAKDRLDGAIKEVARHLGHTQGTTTRDYYTAPRTFDAYLRWARIRAARDHGIDAERFGRIDPWQSRGWRAARGKLNKALRAAKEQRVPRSAAQARKILAAAKKGLPTRYTDPRTEQDYLCWARDQAKLHHGIGARKFGPLRTRAPRRRRR